MLADFIENKAKKIEIVPKSILSDRNRVLSSSVADVNKTNATSSNSSSSTSFRLSEFKREFKRSSFDLSSCFNNTKLDVEMNENNATQLTHDQPEKSMAQEEEPKDLSKPESCATNAVNNKNTTFTAREATHEEIKLTAPVSVVILKPNDDILNTTAHRKKLGKENLLAELTSGLKNQSKKIQEEKRKALEDEKRVGGEKAEEKTEEEEEKSKEHDVILSDSTDLTSSSSSQSITASGSSSSTTSSSTSSSTTTTSSSSSSLVNSSLENAEKSANLSLIANIGLEMSGVSGMLGIVGHNKVQLLTTSTNTSAHVASTLSQTYDSSVKNTDALRKTAAVRASTPNYKSSTNSTTNNSSWLNILNNHSTIKTDPDEQGKNVMASEFVNNKSNRMSHLKPKAFDDALVSARENEPNEKEATRPKLDKFVKRSDYFRKRDETKSENAYRMPKKMSLNPLSINNLFQGKSLAFFKTQRYEKNQKNFLFLEVSFRNRILIY